MVLDVIPDSRAVLFSYIKRRVRNDCENLVKILWVKCVVFISNFICLLILSDFLYVLYIFVKDYVSMFFFSYKVSFSLVSDYLRSNHFFKNKFRFYFKS